MTRLLPALVVVGLLAACTAPRSITVEWGVDLPASLRSDGVIGESGPGAAWKGEDRQSLVVVLYGSSSCAPTPVDLTVDGPGLLAVEFAQNLADACTSDLAANTYRFETPEGVDADGDVDLEITVREIEGTSTVRVRVLD